MMNIYIVVPIKVLYVYQTKMTIELYWEDERVGGVGFV